MRAASTPTLSGPTTIHLKLNAGLLVVSGNLFSSALVKTSVISDEFRRRYLSEPGSEDCFVARAVVFDGPEDYRKRIEDPSLEVDEHSILVVRGAGPVGYPGSAEVVNMTPPGRLVRQGIRMLPCMGDGRQSGTSDSPSILNISPEAAIGGNLAILKNGDQIRVDLGKRRVDVLLSEEEIAAPAQRIEARGNRQSLSLGRVLPGQRRPTRNRRVS